MKLTISHKKSPKEVYAIIKIAYSSLLFLLELLLIIANPPPDKISQLSFSNMIFLFDGKSCKVSLFNGKPLLVPVLICPVLSESLVH